MRASRFHSLSSPIVSLAALVLAAGLLSGCESTRKAVGLEKDAPDEFAVYSRAPLSLPPDYGLQPPAPGAARPVTEDTRAQAKSVLTASPAPSAGQAAARPGDQLAGATPGVQALLRAAGADRADPGIRALINTETRALAADGKKITDAIMFWSKPDEFGTAVDPAKEAKRIQENQALGKPINEGEVPTIGRKDDKYLFSW